MDQSIINWLFAGFGAALGWILKVVWDAIHELKVDIRAIEKDLPDVYVRRDDFRETMAEIKTEMREMRHDMKVSFKHVDDTLNVLFEKLNKKEDRNAR